MASRETLQLVFGDAKASGDPRFYAPAPVDLKLQLGSLDPLPARVVLGCVKPPIALGASHLPVPLPRFPLRPGLKLRPPA